MFVNDKLKSLVGPVMVIGASGFIGANLFRRLINVRSDVTGTVFSGNTWRLGGVPSTNLISLNFEDSTSVRSAFQKVRPKMIFDCSSFGAYSFEQDFERIHTTNYLNFIRLMEEAATLDLKAYVHAGSSSEYGLNATSPSESDELLPNSHYAVSKAAVSLAIKHYGKIHQLPVVNLRLYSVYGPYEDSSRLIPTLCERVTQGTLPVFASPNVTRDFIYVDDVVESFADAALKMETLIAGESFNIGTGLPTTLADLANLTRTIFHIDAEPEFNPNVGRHWDTDNWYSNPEKAKRLLGWSACVSLADGLMKTYNWWETRIHRGDFAYLTKRLQPCNLTKRAQPCKEKNSITAVIACYRDEQAIPIMYERLVSVFRRLDLDYEIIFVNDGSPDNSGEVIREISAQSSKVIGITHSRNFGSQAAFRSGMEIGSKEACVLLDGDLQDPPEVIESFVEHWRAGADIVYGRRVKREMPYWLEGCYRCFYLLFATMSEVPVPKDAGDFSLIDRKAVHWLLQCQERDAFLRGLRAYVGFRQVGVDYIRLERMFGVSTNNWIKNIGWAKKGLFSFSRVPLHILTAFGGLAFLGTFFLGSISIVIRVLAPESIPHGITSLLLLVLFFGSSTILGLGLLGEYIGKILEEVKSRPAFIRENLIVSGKIKTVEPPGGI